MFLLYSRQKTTVKKKTTCFLKSYVYSLFTTENYCEEENNLFLKIYVACLFTTENYCEEENNLFLEKLCSFFSHIF